MSTNESRAITVVMVILLVAFAAIAVVAGIVAVRRGPATRATAPPLEAVPLITLPAAPIAEEAEVFRTAPAMLAIEPDADRQRMAHPRTLETFRFLRMYPGAPPRIPHALSPDEFRTGVCRTCHERGGYSLRFAAYVPLTPHPELGMCLQCHLGEDKVMGTVSSGADPNTRCALCHGPDGGRPRPDASWTWPAASWARLLPTIRDQSPPPIPHDLQLRGNCLACHGGPAAVAEIRSPHPDRVNCRQCHLVPDPGAEEFTRPAQEVVVAPEAAP